MSARRFHIHSPEKLKELNRLVKETPCTAENMARVWTVTRRKQGAHAWDQAIYACFSGDRDRIAEIVRIDRDAEILVCGQLRYNLALRWCMNNLREVRD